MTDDPQPPSAPSSRWQDFWEKTLPVIAGGVIAGVFAIAGSYFATTFQMSAQFQIQKAEEQRKVFASLMGQKIVWEQLNISKVNADTAFDYYQERWKRPGSPNISLDLDEAKYWSHRSGDIISEVTKSSQAILEDVANIQEVFPDTPKLSELCKRIYTFQTMKSPEPPHGGSLDDLTKWKEDTDRSVQVVAQSEYGKPIDDLVAYLLRPGQSVPPCSRPLVRRAARRENTGASIRVDEVSDVV
jgi:hypothetical protein